jgi:hypothetical protein
VIELRKLAALEVLFLGPKLVLAEYACGVLLSVALGIFVLVRGHTVWQILLGGYFICLGLNYLPLLLHAIGLRDVQIARRTIESELGDTAMAFSRYRAQSLLLLVPLFVAIVGVSQWRRIHS